jgi:hypothetical protein
VFNALRTEQLIAGIGATARSAAGADGAPDDYARGQLLSAYSVSRLLAAEVSAEAALLAWLRGELLAALADAGEDPAAADAASRIEAAGDAIEVGGALVDLLAELRARGEDSGLRTRIHSILREMAQRELTALAARPGRSGNVA